MSFIPKPHEIYKHFKGNLYQIVAIAEHTETGESLVIYQAMYGDFKIYARPLEMFTSPVDRAKYPEVTQRFRFELQGADSSRQREAMQEESCVAEAVTAQEPQVAHTAEALTAQEPQQIAHAEAEAAQEPNLDPLVLEFLDADSYEQRLNILAGLHHRITDEMITTMSIACDIEVEDGDTESRYESLKNCLLTLERYECNRLR